MPPAEIWLLGKEWPGYLVQTMQGVCGDSSCLRKAKEEHRTTFCFVGFLVLGSIFCPSFRQLLQFTAPHVVALLALNKPLIHC